MTTMTIHNTGIPFTQHQPRYDAPLPTHFDTGHPIAPEPGIFTVYSWRESEQRWAGIMSTTVESSAYEMVGDLVADLRAKRVPAAYRVEEGA